MPCQWGEATAARLKQVGLEVTYSTVAGLEHDLSRAELAGVLQVMTQRLGSHGENC